MQAPFAACVAAILAVVCSVATRAAPAAAEECPHGGNWQATACVFRNVDDFETNFDDEALSVTAARVARGDHENQEIWLYTRSDYSQFIEMGLRYGTWPGCSCTKYAAFWADWDSAGNEYRHLIGSQSADGRNHNWAIEYGSGGNWNIFYDNNYVGESTNQHTSTTYVEQAGLELSADGAIGPWASSGPFHSTPLKTNLGPWGYQDHWDDYSCDTHPTGACLFQYEPNAHEYDSEKK